MEHSSRTGDPTWRTASSMPITNWWDPLQPQENEKKRLRVVIRNVWGGGKQHCQESPENESAGSLQLIITATEWEETRCNEKRRTSHPSFYISSFHQGCLICVSLCICVYIVRVISHSTWHPCFHGNLWDLTCESEHPAPISQARLLHGYHNPSLNCLAISALTKPQLWKPIVMTKNFWFPSLFFPPQ